MNNRIALGIVSAGMMLLFSSCKTLDMVLNPNSYIKWGNSPVVREIVYDTVLVQVDSQQGLTPAVRGMPTKDVVFTDFGQSVRFRSGDIIRLMYDGVDISLATLQANIDPTNGEVVLSLIRRNEPVRLSRKCQAVIRMDSQIPIVEVKEGLSPEQVVVTPVFNSECKQIGYEIRYGSTERGCMNEAQKTLTQFRNCVDRNKKVKNVRLRDIL